MKYIDTFKQRMLYENNQFDETKSEYYLRRYKDDETFKSVKHNTYEETEYTGREYRKLFMSWYNKIKPFLDKNDEHSVHKILINWDEETLSKFDLYSLVKKYFKNNILKENVNDIEDNILELVITSDKRDKMHEEDEEYDDLYEKWVELIDEIKNYYKNELTKEFDSNGEDGVKKLHKEIIDTLNRNERYSNGTGVVRFDLTEFTRNLIKKKGIFKNE